MASNFEYVSYPNGQYTKIGAGGTNPSIAVTGYQGSEGVSLSNCLAANASSVGSISSSSSNPDQYKAPPDKYNYVRVQVLTASQYVLLNVIDPTNPESIGKPGVGSVAVFYGQPETFRIEPGLVLQVAAPTTTSVNYSIIWIM